MGTHTWGRTSGETHTPGGAHLDISTSGPSHLDRDIPEWGHTPGDAHLDVSTPGRTHTSGQWHIWAHAHTSGYTQRTSGATPVSLNVPRGAGLVAAGSATPLSPPGGVRLSPRWGQAGHRGPTVPRVSPPGGQPPQRWTPHVPGALGTPRRCSPGPGVPTADATVGRGCPREGGGQEWHCVGRGGSWRVPSCSAAGPASENARGAGVIGSGRGRSPGCDHSGHPATGRACPGHHP